ncbi:hypothetical protein D512_09393 [Burkholderia pseudomallei MSHR1043]|nr:hypothetical protein D512_09393 [Burkholderia pseudomallei MSHR1043]
MHRQAAYRTRQSRTPRHGFAQTARRPTGDRPTRAFPIAQVMRDRSSRFAARQISAREQFARPNARASTADENERTSPIDAASAKPPAAERARKPPKPGVPRGRSGAARDARGGGRAAPLRRHAPGVRFRF